MSPRLVWAFLLTVLVADRSFVGAAPFPSSLNEETRDGQLAGKANADLTVEQLEKLKAAESTEHAGTAHRHDTNAKGSLHMETHRLDAALKQNGEIVSQVAAHEVRDADAGQAPRVHAEAEVQMPGAGVHRLLVQEGDRVIVQDWPPVQHDAHKEPSKVFRGAARLVQPSSVAGDTPPAPPAPPQQTATANGNRRSFNADITRETSNNMDHYSPYTGVQYSPLDMAEYVFWTGDERGATLAIEEFLQDGVMTKDDAVTFLQEIKFNIDYLKAHYSQQAKLAEDSLQQEKLRNLLIDQATAKEMYNQVPYRSHPLPSFSFGNSADILKSIANKNYEMSNNILPALSSLPSEYRQEPMKRTLNDPMQQTNVISTSDYDRDPMPMVSEEEYEEMMEKMKAADSLYTEYTLEEVIYQLAKMMFFQSLSRDPMDSKYAMQRFMAFLEAEAERGQLSRNIEKKVLDVMTEALSDTLADHPELVQPRAQEGYGSSVTPSNRLMHQLLEMGVSEPSISRAILTAYKDELTKGQMMQKLKGFST